MNRILTVAAILMSFALWAWAGVAKVVTYPVRHPVKVVKTTAKVTKKVLW